MTQSDPEAALDLAIVGGGAAGAYAAYRLRALHPEWSISLFEASGRIGGRLLSLIPPGGGDGPRAELGGMRFREGHHLVNEIVRSLGLKTRPFVTADPQNRFYLRGEARTAADEPEQRGRGYRLDERERGRSAGELLLASFEQAVPGSTTASEDQLAGLVQSQEFKGRPLYEWSLDDVFAATLSADAHQFVIDSFGYHSGIGPHNAADAIPYLLREAGPHLDDQLAPVDGMERLPRELVERFEAIGGEVQLGHRLISFDVEGGGDGHPVLRLQLDGRPAITVRRLVLAMPRVALESIAGASPPMRSQEINDLLGAVEAFPAHKLYLLYDRPWWREGDGIGRLDVSDLPLRKTYYLDGVEGTPGESGLMLASYTDGQHVDPWRELADGRAPALDRRPFGALDRWDEFAAPPAMIDAAQGHLRAMHGRQIPEPVSSAFINWDVVTRGGAWHYWKAGARSWEVKSRIVQPVPDLDVCVCGEAYSTAQAWVEGALETAEVVVQRLS
jgi:monoamine oxidase